MRPVKVEQSDVSRGLIAAFRQAGYAGASMRELSAATGLKSASLYHRFGEGKAAMALAALADAGTALREAVIAPLLSEAPPLDRLEASASGADAFYEGGGLVCLLSVLALSDAPPSVTDAVSAALDGWIGALAETLADAGHHNPRAEAVDRIAALQGALIFARAGQGRDAFGRALARMRSK